MKVEKTNFKYTTKIYWPLKSPWQLHGNHTQLNGNISRCQSEKKDFVVDLPFNRQISADAPLIGSQYQVYSWHVNNVNKVSKIECIQVYFAERKSRIFEILTVRITRSYEKTKRRLWNSQVDLVLFLKEFWRYREACSKALLHWWNSFQF